MPSMMQCHQSMFSMNTHVYVLTFLTLLVLVLLSFSPLRNTHYEFGLVSLFLPFFRSPRFMRQIESFGVAACTHQNKYCYQNVMCDGACLDVSKFLFSLN
jgi:hypothetical protein